MIQRQQTLWLLLTAVLMSLTLFMPLARYVAGSEQLVLRAFGLMTDPAGNAEAVTVVSTVYMGIVLAAAALLPLVSIFLYKDLLLQFRLCITECVLLLGSAVFIAFCIFRGMRGIDGFEFSATRLMPAAAFPVAAFLAVCMAVRGIVRDRRILSSLNRIR